MNISGKERYILSIIFPMLCCSCMPHSIAFRKYAHRYIGQSLVYFDGFYRAFAGMSLGIIAWNIIRQVGPSLSDAGRFFFRIFGHVMLAMVLVTSLFKYHGFCDFWFIFLSFCGRPPIASHT